MRGRETPADARALSGTISELVNLIELPSRPRVPGRSPRFKDLLLRVGFLPEAEASGQRLWAADGALRHNPAA